MSGPLANTPAPAMDPALLERLRTSGIRLDREGVFWHEGEPVRHEGMRRAFLRWLDRLPPPDDRYVLRLDDKRFAYLEVEDTPVVATSLRWQGDEALLGLNDGSEERLDPENLDIDSAGVLRCRVTLNGRRLEARLSTAAAATLSERIVGPPTQPALLVAGTPRPIRSRATRP